MAEDEPLALERAYFPLQLVEAFDASILQRASIYDEIERRHGLRITRTHEAIRPAVLDKVPRCSTFVLGQRHSASKAPAGQAIAVWSGRRVSCAGIVFYIQSISKVATCANLLER